MQTSASDWDAARQLALLWAGGDDAAAAQERSHQPRPVHRLAGHHDQGEYIRVFVKHWLKLNFRTCLQHSSSEATSNLSSPSTPSSLAGHEKLFIDYLFFYTLKLSFELFLMTNVSHQESIKRCPMSEYEMLIKGIHVFTNHEVLTNCLILSQYPVNWCVSPSYGLA